MTESWTWHTAQRIIAAITFYHFMSQSAHLPERAQKQPFRKPARLVRFQNGCICDIFLHVHVPQQKVNGPKISPSQSRYNQSFSARHMWNIKLMPWVNMLKRQTWFFGGIQLSQWEGNWVLSQRKPWKITLARGNGWWPIAVQTCSIARIAKAL